MLVKEAPCVDGCVNHKRLLITLHVIDWEDFRFQDNVPTLFVDRPIVVKIRMAIHCSDLTLVCVINDNPPDARPPTFTTVAVGICKDPTPNRRIKDGRVTRKRFTF
jgi:hypothetical protein